MMGGLSRRGQPLIVLVLVLGGWVSARAMMWDPSGVPAIRLSEFVPVAELAIPAKGLRPEAESPVAGAPARMSVPTPSMPYDFGFDGAGMSAGPSDHGVDGSARLARQPEPGGWAASPSAPAPAPHFAPAPAPHFAPEPAPRPLVAAPPGPVVMPVTPAIAVGHQLLWMAALSQIPMPATLLAMPDPRSRPAPFYPAGSEPLRAGQVGARRGGDRWSVDSWVLWRRGSTAAPAGGLLIPSYGASQAGAVLRYQLAPGSARRSNIYLRTTAALNGSSEREVALGLALRPISRLPVSLQGEARYTAAPGTHALRPAVLAVTELPPFALPLGMRGEVYGQAGYVGGKFATGFADGQLRVDRRLVQLGKADVRLGGGAWGGIQKGASRLDAGPSLTIGQPLGGPASIRLGADWRFRVAGKAAPGSGPAVTLSAGF